MNTRVELKLSEKANTEIINEVKMLSKMNTSDEKSIEVLKDKKDDKLLIIKFKSHKGKSIDLADKIMKSYSLYLDSYSDISVLFETKRNKLK